MGAMAGVSTGVSIGATAAVGAGACSGSRGAGATGATGVDAVTTGSGVTTTGSATTGEVLATGASTTAGAGEGSGAGCAIAGAGVSLSALEGWSLALLLELLDFDSSASKVAAGYFILTCAWAAGAAKVAAVARKHSFKSANFNLFLLCFWMPADTDKGTVSRVFCGWTRMESNKDICFCSKDTSPTVGHCQV